MAETSTKRYPIILASPKERAAERDANTNWSDHLLTEVEVGKDDWVYVTVGDALSWGDRSGLGGWSCGIQWPADKPKAEVGIIVRFWNGGLGRSLSGASVQSGDEWVPIFYKTKREQEVEHASWIADNQRRQREQYEQHKDVLDADYENLVPDLKRRIDRFRAEDPDFRWNSESYEMAAVAEANRIYLASQDPTWGQRIKDAGFKAPTEEAKTRSDYTWTENDGTLDWEVTPENSIRAFDAINSKINGYQYGAMKQFLPDMDDGHSGNTWAHAVGFALALVRGQGDKL